MKENQNESQEMSPKPTESADVPITDSSSPNLNLDSNSNSDFLINRKHFSPNFSSQNTDSQKEGILKNKAPLNDLTGVNSEDFISKYEAAYEPPSFSIKELRDAIPPHLFEKNLLKSTLYLVVNLTAVALIFYAGTFISQFPKILQIPLWAAYWWFQGIAATGIWVIAHECGHQSFSNSKAINNFVGLIFHSFLLVPYHPWRISHAQHHASTGHIGQDQVFVPKRRSDVKAEKNAWEEALEASPLYTIFNALTYLTLGWPAYLFAHKSGKKYQEFACHFLPSSPIFEPKHKFQVLLSDIMLIAVLSTLGALSYFYTFSSVVAYYGIPYLFVNGWLVTITLLQHTDVYLPHYSASEWNFVRGALTTVDRDYGWFLNHALHHIQDSHVAHHLFSQMPHYNAIEATKYLKEKLGEYYLYDQTPVWRAIYRAVRNCVFVEDEGDVLFYRNHLKKEKSI